mgnify:FL=1
MLIRNENRFRCFVWMIYYPKNHLLRVIDKAIDWNFIYNLVEDKYSAYFGGPSMDSVMLIKIPFIQYLYERNRS